MHGWVAWWLPAQRGPVREARPPPTHPPARAHPASSQCIDQRSAPNTHGQRPCKRSRAQLSQPCRFRARPHLGLGFPAPVSSAARQAIHTSSQHICAAQHPGQRCRASGLASSASAPPRCAVPVLPVHSDAGPSAP